MTDTDNTVLESTSLCGTYYYYRMYRNKPVCAIVGKDISDLLCNETVACNGCPIGLSDALFRAATQGHARQQINKYIAYKEKYYAD